MVLQGNIFTPPVGVTIIAGVAGSASLARLPSLSFMMSVASPASRERRMLADGGGRHYLLL